MRRSAKTLEITWSNITLDKEDHEKPIVMEKLRETLGLHTCDRRSKKSELEKIFPDFEFEQGFAENDTLYDPELREPNDARALRLREALEDIVKESKEETYITLSAHSGAITSLLEIGRAHV